MKKIENFIVFDVETESLNLRNSRPWQVAYSVYEKNNLVHQACEEILWDDFKISKGAAIITKFDHAAYLRKAKPAEQVLNRFNKYFLNDKYRKIGHNILHFDVYQYRNWCDEVGKDYDWESIISRCVDTHALAKGICFEDYPENMEDLDGFVAWSYRQLSVRKRGLKTSLTALGKKYEITFDENQLHDALNDIKLNLEVFYRQQDEIIYR